MKTDRRGLALTFALAFVVVFGTTVATGENNYLTSGLTAFVFAAIFTAAYEVLLSRGRDDRPTKDKKEAPPPPTTPTTSTVIDDIILMPESKKDSVQGEIDDGIEDAKIAIYPPEASVPGSIATGGPTFGKQAELDESEVLSRKRSEPRRDEPSEQPMAPPSSPPPPPVVATEERPSPSKPVPPSEKPSTEVPEPKPSPESAEEVQFTLYHPKEVAPSKWYTLLTYVHILEALESVQQDAHKFRAEMAYDPREVKSRKTAKLMRGTELRLVPSAEGIEFNPPDLKLTWIEDYHRASFRFKASSDILGEPANGEVAIYVGPLEIATIRFSIFVTDTPTEGQDESQQAVQAAMYKRIFTSYSHRDTAIVKACVAAFKAIGYDVLIDYETLRSGEIWSADLERMIDEADIFQLFWSPNSAGSKFVRQEWERALSRTYGKAPGEGFIRPVYWLQPMPDVPDELGHLHFKFMEDLAALNDAAGS